MIFASSQGLDELTFNQMDTNLTYEISSSDHRYIVGRLCVKLSSTGDYLLFVLHEDTDIVNLFDKEWLNSTRTKFRRTSSRISITAD